MSLMTIWRLMWDMWLTLPECSCASKQGRKPCKCKGK